MPRKRERVSNRGPSADLMKRAAALVIKENRSQREVAKELKICHVTLNRYIKSIIGEKEMVMGYKPHNKVLSHENELIFCEFIRKSSDLYFGLTPKDIRGLVYQFAVEQNLKFPEKWKETHMAGEDWFTNFMKRHPEMSIRSPDPISHARTVEFASASLTDIPLIVDGRVEEQEPVPSTSKEPNVNISTKGTLEAVRLTETPEINELIDLYKKKSENESLVAAKRVNKNMVGNKSKQLEEDSSSSEEEDSVCPYCHEAFSNNKAEQVWIQCNDCKKWAHKECARKNRKTMDSSL